MCLQKLTLRNDLTRSMFKSFARVLKRDWLMII